MLEASLTQACSGPLLCHPPGGTQSLPQPRCQPISTRDGWWLSVPLAVARPKMALHLGTGCQKMGPVLWTEAPRGQAAPGTWGQDAWNRVPLRQGVHYLCPAPPRPTLPSESWAV